MEKIAICGQKKLCGSVKIQGAKNSVLPILAATLLTDGVCNLKNAPRLSDVSSCALILERLGAKISLGDDVLTVKRNKNLESNISKDLMSSMRSSVFFLAPLISRTGIAAVYLPGGCVLGERPIDMHLDGLRKMGVNIRYVDEKILCYAENGLFGTEHLLRFPSVGATETLLMAGVLAKGRTVIRNAAREPEVVDLAMFLKAAGADIVGEGTDVITIVGVERLNGCRYTIIPDRIETATFLCAAAATGGSVEVTDTRPEHVLPLCELLQKSGAQITYGNNSISLCSDAPLKGLGYIKTEVYPGFATDAAPLLAAVMLTSQGETVISDTIFTDRFRCALEFSKLGAKLMRKGNSLVIEGTHDLFGNTIRAGDLRGGAALLIAALAAKGDSVLEDSGFIRRGYENVVASYQKLGAQVAYC